MKRYLLIILSISFFTETYCQTPTLQERLGYPKNTRLLIIHADDLGVSHSENAASIAAMEKGSVNSASIMVPCPWFPEIAAYARQHPQADLGLHLTLTSEWKYLKWGPVTPQSDVPGLVNKWGFFYESADSVHRHASATEVEKELRAQIERAKKFGIDITHLDSHMGTLFGKEEFLKVYLQLGREYKVPVMISKQFNAGHMLTPGDIVVDMIHTANPPNFKEGMQNYYLEIFKSLQPGVSVLLIHTAYEDREMKAVTIDHPDWGASWRQADVDFFMSDACRKALKDNNIRLITWREIRDKLVRTGK